MGGVEAAQNQGVLLCEGGKTGLIAGSENTFKVQSEAAPFCSSCLESEQNPVWPSALGVSLRGRHATVWQGEQKRRS